MFRKKTIRDDAKLETRPRHKLAGLESISSIFKNHTSEPRTDTTIDKSSIEESILISESDLPKPSTSKTVRLIQEVQKLEDRTIKPFIDFNEDSLFYPIL